MTSRSGGFLLLFRADLVPGGARVQISFPPVTSGNFKIDLFEQPARGCPRFIALGAIDAVAEGAAGL